MICRGQLAVLDVLKGFLRIDFPYSLDYPVCVDASLGYIQFVDERQCLSCKGRR